MYIYIYIYIICIYIWRPVYIYMYSYVLDVENYMIYCTDMVSSMGIVLFPEIWIHGSWSYEPSVIRHWFWLCDWRWSMTVEDGQWCFKGDNDSSVIGSSCYLSLPFFLLRLGWSRHFLISVLLLKNHAVFFVCSWCYQHVEKSRFFMGIQQPISVPVRCGSIESGRSHWSAG